MRLWHWIQYRGGVARWESINLSNLQASWSTPVLGEDHRPVGKPSWQAADVPAEVEVDPAKVTVYQDEEVKRIRIAVRRASGLTMKLTDASSKRLRSAMAKAGEGSYYVFEANEAIIMRPVSSMTLLDWAKSKSLA